MSKTFLELKKNLRKESNGFKGIKLAVLADSASQHFTMALKANGIENNINFEIYEADFDQIEIQIRDLNSELYKSSPEFIVLFFSIKKLYKSFLKTTTEQRSTFANWYIQKTKELIYTAFENSSARIILLNFPELNDGIFGNFASKLNSSWIYQQRLINLELMRLSQNESNLFLVDVALLSNKVGEVAAYDPKLYVYGDIIFKLDFLPELTKNITDVILAISGKFKKCLILDLDNTLWGGIIGDDGVEGILLGEFGDGKAFTQLQYWAKELKQRGIILAICSKNTESIAKEPFLNHPDMILRLDDIAVFVANWENKVDNIKFIQSVLNIGFDSMVFIDDNPFERNIVRENIPEINVPELPEDSSEYLQYLISLNLFETASYSNEDANRTQQYQTESARVVLAKSFQSEAEYLVNLNMLATVKPFEKFTIPRVAQLSQRSNQFNLRTVRYTDDDILKISNSDKHISFSISLEDKFGDYGLISVIVLEKLPDALFIETWLMSCRVLKRSVERYTLNYIVEKAKKMSIKKIIGEYIPTAKNEIVKDHYQSLGFTLVSDGKWILELDKLNEGSFYIQTKE